MGQAKKRRACPAVNREISSAECGENRLSRYACPEACPFNPFTAANYSALLATEDALDIASVKRLAQENPAAPETILAAQRASPGHGAHAETVRQLFFKRDAGGRTFAERWEQAGWPGLKNDDRVFIRGKMQMRVALLEVHRILDDQRFEAVDLLAAAPVPMIFVDRSLAARAVRFATFLTWVYPLPHFWRMSGTGITLSDLGPFSALEMLDACIAHLGGPPERVAQGGWLAENFERIDAALMATGHERRRQMLASIDASWSSANYQMQGTLAKARGVLEKAPAAAEEQLNDDDRAKGFIHAFVWFDDARPDGPSPAQQVGGRPVLGRVLLGKKEWRVEAMGEARFRRLRAAFEARMGDKVIFLRERRDDLGGQMAAKEPSADLALVPPRLLEQPTTFELSSSRLPEPPAGMSLEDCSAALLANHRRDWIDRPLPSLDGRTPREAAGEPALRARLIELAKTHVRQHDEKNLQSGRSDDINGWIRELGLTELDFPPPPFRAPPPESDDPADNAGAEDESFAPRTVDPSRPPAPRLRDEPLSIEEAARRLDRAVRQFDLATDAMEELAASGATVIEDLSALTADLLSKTDFTYLAPFIIQGWFALVPPGVQGPSLDFDAMAAEYDGVLEKFGEGADIAQAAFVGLRDRCRQPGMMDALAGNLLQSVKSAPKKIRPRDDVIPIMLLALATMLNALDAALRRR